MKPHGGSTPLFFKQCGRRGGRARARRLTSSRRSAIAAQAASARWQNLHVTAKQSSCPVPSVRLRGSSWDDPAYLQEILSEGSLEDWGQLYESLADRPFGGIAEALKQVLVSEEIYGVTPLWKGILQGVQGVPL